MIEQKKLENVEYLNNLGSMITNDTRCTREIKTRTGRHDNSRIQPEEDCFHQQIGLKFKEETGEVLHLEQSTVWC